MRLNDFEDIEEVVELGIIEFHKRSTAPTMNWMPLRQNVYTSQCRKYSDMLLTIGKASSKEMIIQADMNPSQFIKSAQDFQLAARMSGMEREDIYTNFVKLANIGMMLKRHYYSIYSKKIKKIEFSREAEIIAKANQLNGLLRAFSEAVYLDDHTVSGEFYGDLHIGDQSIIVRSYKRLCPSDLLDGFDEFKIQKIETYCTYKCGQIDFDCLGNIQYVDQVRPEIDSFYAECCLVNGDCIVLNNISAIDDVINTLENQFKKVLMLFFNADKHEQGRMLLKSSYYAFKPILEKLGFSWYPSDNDIALYLTSLSRKTEFDKIVEEKSVLKIKEENHIRKVVDPRYSI